MTDRKVKRRDFVKATTVGAMAGLAGCNRSGNILGVANDDVSGRINVVWSAFPEFADQMPAIRKTLWEGGLPRNIYVQHVPQPGADTNDLHSQYQTWLSAGRSKPDIILGDTAWTIPLVVGDQVANLSNRLSQQAINEINSNYISQLVPTVKNPLTGDLHGVPMTVDLAGIQYRKDFVRKAGYDPDKEDWATSGMTWKKFSKVTKDTLEQNPDINYGYTFQGAAVEGLSCCNFNEWMTSFGGAYFGGRKHLFGPVDDRPITVTEKPVLDAIRMIRTFLYGEDDPHALDGYAGNICPSGNLQWTATTSATPFLNDDAVMNRIWPTTWIKSAQRFGDDIGVMPIPAGVSEQDAKYKGTGGIARSFVGGWANMLNPNSEEIHAAVKVIESMIDNVPLRKVLFNELAFIPPNLKLLNSDTLAIDTGIGPFLDVLQVSDAKAIPRAATVAWNPESAAISKNVHRALTRETTPEAAMSDLEESLQDIETAFKRT